MASNLKNLVINPAVTWARVSDDRLLLRLPDGEQVTFDRDAREIETVLQYLRTAEGRDSVPDCSTLLYDDVVGFLCERGLLADAGVAGERDWFRHHLAFVSACATPGTGSRPQRCALRGSGWMRDRAAVALRTALCAHDDEIGHHASQHGAGSGGATGSRHLSRHGSPVSRNTLLRRVRSVCLPEGPAPEIIGIDDWAWRKGHRYGTIIVDLQRGCPIDVLEDRAAETVATWLQSHPDVTIVARDRAEVYAAGMRQGAPVVTQVADRFHLLKNLAAAL